MNESSRSAVSGLGRGAVLGGLAGLIARDLDLPALASYWGDRAPLVAAAALAGAVLGATRLRSLPAGAAGVLSAVWLVVAFTPVARALTEGLVRRDAVRPADAVFVLASRLQRDGEPTSVAMGRLQHALELLSEGMAPRLILSELPAPFPSHAAHARELMRRLGLERELLSVGPVWRTRDEALAVAALCRERGWTRVLVVTSPAHSRRAAAALERTGLQVLSSPAIETRYDLPALDRGEERLLGFGVALHEWVGLWVYARRGWTRDDAGRSPAGRQSG